MSASAADSRLAAHRPRAAAHPVDRPDTEMAAITTPGAVAHRRDTPPRQARVRPRFAQPRRHTSASSGAEPPLATWPLGWRRRCGPATLAPACGHRQPCPDRDRIAKARSWFQCGYADPRRSRGDIPRRCRWRRAAEAVPPRTPPAVDRVGGGVASSVMADRAASGHPVAPQQAMHSSGRQPVCGGSGQVGSIAEFGQSAGRSGDRAARQRFLSRTPIPLCWVSQRDHSVSYLR